MSKHGASIQSSRQQNRVSVICLQQKLFIGQLIFRSQEVIVEGLFGVFLDELEKLVGLEGPYNHKSLNHTELNVEAGGQLDFVREEPNLPLLWLFDNIVNQLLELWSKLQQSMQISPSSLGHRSTGSWLFYFRLVKRRNFFENKPNKEVMNVVLSLYFQANNKQIAVSFPDRKHFESPFDYSYQNIILLNHQLKNYFK